MIQNPWLLSGVLFAVVLSILRLSTVPSFKKLFHYLPSPFWCYFLPMVLSTFGLLPEKSPVYGFLTTYLLSGCLILLLLNVNLPAILRLGPAALGALAVGAVGVCAGAVGSFAVFGRWLPPETWKGVGALCASWTGGSANMLAVKEGLQTPESVFAPMVIVDTLMTYLWMGIVIALAGFQDRWDRWVKADSSMLKEAEQRLTSGTVPTEQSNASVGTVPTEQRSASLGTVPTPAAWYHALWLLGGSMGIGAVCLALGRKLPSLGGTLSPSGWAFLIVTLIGILLSLTPAAKLERYGASRWGYVCLYLLLAAMGAKARLQYIFQAPLLLLMAVFWVSTHALLLAVYGYLRRVPMFFLAASSQANIGGTASAPIVAGIYQPALAPVGLLLAIAINVVGTYIGYAVANLCRLIYP